MTLLGSLSAIAGAEADGAIDWAAAVEAATAATPAGSLALTPAERGAFATDVADAAAAIREVTGLPAPTPSVVSVEHRHHWIEQNAATFEALMAPIDSPADRLQGVVGRVNTATVATLLSALGRAVLGQYDPGLFGAADPRLAFVLPNLQRAGPALGVEDARFRRWIAFHEVTHVAEFDAAPWLRPHLEGQVERAVDALAGGGVDVAAIRQVDATMTAVEGYAEFVMDRAFDARSDDLRAALDARRRRGGPLRFLLGRLVGLDAKRRQYERGKRFFDAVAADRGVAATAAVWASPDALPTRAEIAAPARWLDRVDP